MPDFDSNLVVTDRRVRRRRQMATSMEPSSDSSVRASPNHSDSNVDEASEQTDEQIARQQRREIADRRRADRRRQIDPTTCERDYTGGEIEFMRAMDDYKRKSGRPFPTWSEVLEVLLSLGYRKVAEPTTMEWRTFGDSSSSSS